MPKTPEQLTAALVERALPCSPSCATCKAIKQVSTAHTRECPGRHRPAVIEAFLPVVRALKEIGDDDSREQDWCDSCKKWVTVRYASGYDLCPHCDEDISDRTTITRLQEIAQGALAAAGGDDA